MMQTKFIFLFFMLSSNIFSNTILNLESVSEPSGITYNPNNNMLYIVGDEGFLYEADLEGEIVRKVFLGKFDLEGITYNSDTNTLFCLNEKKIEIIEINLQSLKISRKISLRKELKSGKRQFESLTYKPSTVSTKGTFFIASSLKSGKGGVINCFYIKKSKIELNNEYEIPLLDIAGLSYYNNQLYMVSDDEDSFAVLDLTTNNFNKRKIQGEHQEGIVVIDENTKLILDEVKKIYYLKNP